MSTSSNIYIFFYLLSAPFFCTVEPRGICTNDAMCEAGKECVGGTCGSRCREEGDCTDPHEFCLHEQCVTKCTQDNVCFDYQICVESLCSIPCQNSDGCPCPGVRNSICLNNVCHRRCMVNEDCAPNTYCIEGVCRVLETCSSDSDCQYSSVCSGGKCVESCASRPCPSTHNCTNQVCMTKLSTTSASCPVSGCGCGQVCSENTCTMQERIGLECIGANNFCGYNAICANSSTLKCDCIRNRKGHCLHLSECQMENEACQYLTPGSECSGAVCACGDSTSVGSVIAGVCYPNFQVCRKDDLDCPPDHLCRGNHCYKVCSDDGGCPGKMACYENVCTVTCWRHEDCDSKQLCVNGMCTQTCRSNDDCDENRQSCYDGKCKTKCSERENICGDGTVCVNSIGCFTSCVKDEHCLPDLEVCVNGVCSVACRTKADCTSPSVCINGRCYIKCTTDGDCYPTRQSCQLGICAMGCLVSSECGPREVCAYRKCRIICLTDDDCLSPLICSAGICSAKCKIDGIGDRSCVSGDDCTVRNEIEACVSTCASTCSEIQYCNIEQTFCYEVYKIACVREQQCEPHFYCKKEQGDETGICEPKALLERQCLDGACGFNELCVDNMCRCIRNSEGDCLGPYNYCPEFKSNPGVCRHEVYGSVCVDLRNTCECPEGQVEIARKCVNTTVCVADVDCEDASCISYHCYDHCGPDKPCIDNFVCTHGLCSFECEGHAHCDYNQLCMGGICVTACKSEDSELCGVHQKCDMKQGICRMTCDADDQCTNVTTYRQSYCSRGLCLQHCDSSADCDVKSICDSMSKTCITLCVDDIDCSPREHCIAGFCIPTCKVPADCPDRYVCKLGLCAPQCETNADCITQVGKCYNQQCVYACVPGVTEVCGGGACAGGFCSAHCSKDVQCGTGAVRCDAEKGGCYITCTANSDCLSGQICGSDGVCGSVNGMSCTSQSGGSECGDRDLSCYGSVCVPNQSPGKSCNIPTDCSKGEYCNDLSQCQCVKSISGGCQQLTSCSTDEECVRLDVISVCNVERRVCECPAKTRLSPYGCISDVKSCMTREDCKNGENCYDFKCLTECNTNPLTEEEIEGTSEDVCPEDTRCRNYFCQQSCYSDVGCPTRSQSCVGDTRYGVCLTMCTQTLMYSTPCVEGITSSKCSTLKQCSKSWDCVDGFCVHLCSSDVACARNQKCVRGFCRCNHAEYLCSSPNLEMAGGNANCANDRDCRNLERCVNGLCICQLGGVRDANGLCVWNLDAVCHNCPACINRCYGDNMVCNKNARLCVCAEGYILDASGIACTEISGATTNIPCRRQVDCSGFPSSTCSLAIGRCVCQPGLCFEDGDCVLDRNECVENTANNFTGCPEGMVCINTPCRKQPQCVETAFHDGLAMFGVNDPDSRCFTSENCKEYSSEACYHRRCGTSYCFNGKCTCERGAVLVKNEDDRYKCVLIRCTKNSECPGWSICTERGLCVYFGEVTLPPTTPAPAIDVKNEATIALSSLGALLFVLALVFLLYKKCAPTKAEKQKRYWEAEEARLAAEEADLDRMEQEFEIEQQRRKEEYLRMLREKREQQAREKAERAELERLKREEEERLLREQRERQEAERLRRLQEEKEAKAREKKLKKEARLRAIAERKARAEAERKRLAAEAEAERIRIEEERRRREEEEAARLKAEKEAEERLKREQEEKERRLREEQEAKRRALKKQQEAARKAREKAARDRIEAIKRAHQLEQERIAEEKRKASQALLNRQPVEEDEGELGESGWSAVAKAK